MASSDSFKNPTLRRIDWHRLLKSVIMVSNFYLRDRMRSVGFLLLPEFSNLGLAAAIEPLFIANWLAQRPVFEWKTVSIDGRPVRASNATLVAVDAELAAAPEFSTVLVLASFDPLEVARQSQILKWLKRMARTGAELGGIENGSLVLAQAGLLSGHQVAVHWDNLAGFQEHFPASRAVPHLYCRSGDRISCAGASAILDMMVAWIGWHGEPELAAEVADHLLLSKVRPSQTEQRLTPNVSTERGDAVVAKAQTLMAAHLEEPLSCREIARRVGLSLRQIERRFLHELRSTVLQHYRRVRMAKAHQLLQQTSMSVIDVAVACGFSSPEYFCRVYRQQFGWLPSRDRRQSTTAPVLRRSSPRLAGKRTVTPRGARRRESSPRT
jgi:AraC family transcriptional regulator, carnitine catabolism transcriptional activator